MRHKKLSFLSDIRSLPSAGKRYLLSQFLGAGYFLWPIYILYMTQHYSVASAGVYLSATALTQTLMEVPTGYIADRIGQSKAVLFGQALRAASLVLLVAVSFSAAPLLMGILYGLGGALVSGAASALVYENLSHAEYERTMHHEISVFQLGLLSSAAIGGFLYKIAPAVPFVATAIVLFTSALPLLALKESFHNEEQATMKDAAKALKHMLTTKATLIYIFGFSWLYMMTYILVDILLEARMIELSISPSSRGLVISGVKITIFVLLQLVILRLVNSVPKKLFVALLMAVAVFPLLGMGDSASLFIGLYFLINFMTVFMSAATSPIAQKLVSSRYRATELSLMSMCSSAVYSAAAVAIGVYMTHHSTKGIFIVFGAGALCVSAPLLLWSLRNYLSQTKPATIDAYADN